MEKVLELINQFDGEIYDLCFKLLNENEQHSEVFQFVCENLLCVPESPSIQIEKSFEKEEIDEYIMLYGDIVNGIIKSTIKKCDYGIVSSKDFYKKVWESYSINLSSLKEKAFAFYYTIIDKRIPYIYIGKPLSMEQNEFARIIKENLDCLKQIDYIFNSSYNQKTEIASLVLQCIDNIDDYEVKVVALSRALDRGSKKRRDGKNIDLDTILQAIDRKIEELEQLEQLEQEKEEREE